MVPLSPTERIEAIVFLVLGALLCAVVAAFLLDLNNEDESDRYWIEFEESITGIDENTQVYFQGIPCGKVTAIELSAAQITPRVWIEVKPNLPLTTMTRARIALSTFLGRLHIELENEVDRAPPLIGQNIESSKSKMSKLMNTGESLGEKLVLALENAIELTSAARQEELFASIRSIGEAADALGAAIPRLERELTATTTSLRTTTDLINDRLVAYDAPVRAILEEGAVVVTELRQLLRNGTIDRLLKDSDTAVLSLQSSLERALKKAEDWLARNDLADRLDPFLSETSSSLQTTLSDFQSLLRRLETESTLLIRGELTPTLSRLATLADRLTRVVALVERQPRALLFGEPRAETPLPRGPESPR